jgi:glycosyltransferase involved in cell wall biosynthesis
MKIMNIIKRNNSNWICFQIGAREHYAIPRILEKQQQLTHFISDAWVTPQSPFNLLPKSILSNLRERYHLKLASASIYNFNYSLIEFEIKQKIALKSGWQTIINRNQWFQKKGVKLLKNTTNKIGEPVTIFAYSYAALEILKFAKKQGWQTILGQIDPGIYEEKLVAEECDRYFQYTTNWQPAPSEYWETWQQECHLADRIVVNSDWSSHALQKTGISPKKIKVIPLAYKQPEIAKNFTRVYPQSFSNKRPLKVLFLGQIILRKGIAKIFEAIELLKEQPIEFWFVGSININIPQEIQNNPQVKWIGSVSRSMTANYYQQADVFLFPTLSDGFGLTQLEAQAWQLPIIASTCCGAVVQDRMNGLILSEVTGENIANYLLFCLKNPDLLNKFSQESLTTLVGFSISKLGNELQLLSQNLISKK